MLQIPELLAPAGDLERLRYAVNYGADAVYCGLPEFGMRSAPANFTPEQLTEGVIYAHARGRKVYLTMNTLPTNEEADRLPEAIKEAAKAGVDAFIVADLGVLEACKTFAPDIDVHMSTQTGITNWAAARAAYDLGAKRVVLAREMTLQDIATIRDKTPPELEIEAFVHGAMCMSVSGRCLLSTYMTAVSAPSPAAGSTSSARRTVPASSMRSARTRTAATSSTPTICAPRPSLTSSARRAWTA